MNIRYIGALCLALCMIVFGFFPAAGFADDVCTSTATLKVGDASGNVDQTLEIPITVDNPATIAGAALTIQYSSSLEVTVDSTFFDTFYNQLNDPNLTTMGDPVDLGGGSYKFPVLDDNGNQVTDDNGDPVFVIIPPEVGGQQYPQPLITNKEYDGTTVSHHISAARVMPADSGGETTLFMLHVSLKEGEPTGDYPISIIPTTLSNTDAGYSADGETIDLLVGSDLNESIDSGNAFPVVLCDDDYSSHVIAGHVTFAADSDGDNLNDSWEMQYFGNLSTSDGTIDSDHDGYTDLQEYTNDTDPTDGTTAAGLAGYSLCTDARVATVTLSSSGSSAPGETLVVTATYDAGTEANSGVDVSIFFNSTKVTYAGYNTDTFLDAGAVTKPEVANVQDDTGNADNDSTTDKMIQMSWSSTALWPGVSLPAVLADLNFTVNQSSQQGDELVFNIIDNSQDPGFAFCGQGVTATVNTWNLDVDGDGTVGGLTDGLLIARYLFDLNGSAGWTEGFVNTGATRDESAIGAYIQSLIK